MSVLYKTKNIIPNSISYKQNQTSITTVFFILLLILFIPLAYTQDISSDKKNSNQKLKGIEEYKVKSNILKSENGKILSLNPIKIVSHFNDTYYVLRLEYDRTKWNLRVYAGDKMEINIDGHPISIEAHNLQSSVTQVTAFYEIEMLDLIDIGNADSVKVRIYDKDESVELAFSSKNIRNFHEFVSDNILLSKSEIKAIAKRKSPSGFISFGGGKGFELWIGMYTDIIEIKNYPGLRDFVSIGLGYASFRLKEYLRIATDSEYILNDEYKFKPLYFNLMYGFSYVAKSWPIDVGITMQYYTYDSYHVFISNWDNGTTYINGIRIYEKKLEGDILSQLHFGIFIQAGIYYLRINNGKHWSAGFRIPLK